MMQPRKSGTRYYQASWATDEELTDAAAKRIADAIEVELARPAVVVSEIHMLAAAPVNFPADLGPLQWIDAHGYRGDYERWRAAK